MNRERLNRQEIEEFLERLVQKIRVFGIVFRSRDKNLQVLAELGITALHREKFLTGLNYKNYSTGPNKDNYDMAKPDYYEFGVNINGEEVYIKISPGLENKPVDCMSFHIAEYKMSYPLKGK